MLSKFGVTLALATLSNAVDLSTLLRVRTGVTAPECPCLDHNSIAHNGDGTITVERAGGDELREEDYGESMCFAWDERGNRDCATDSSMGMGTPLSDAPYWCADPWCFVSEDCGSIHSDLELWTPGDGSVYYSYENCAGVDTSTDTNTDGQEDWGIDR